MKGKTKKIVLAVAVIGAIAAGGVAFTDANVVPHNSAGYGTSVVSGATATELHHILSGDGQAIASTTMTITGTLDDQPIVKAGFGTADLQDCVTSVATGVLGATDRTATVVCTYSPTYVTADETAFSVAVTS
jgi:hypothetical protein